MIQAIQLILALSFLVLIHELGHFTFARIFKVRVEKFYMFFNPWMSLVRIKKFDGKWHVKFLAKNEDEEWAQHPENTEWGIGWLPFGGYCAIGGMVDETHKSEDLSAEVQPWEFRAKPAWQRMLIILGGIMVNFIGALVIYWMLIWQYGKDIQPLRNMHQGIYYSQILLDEGFEQQDKILTVDGKTPKDLKDVVNAFIYNVPCEVEVLRGDTIAHVTVSNFRKHLLNKDFEQQGPIISAWLPCTIDTVIPNMPAALAGLQKGDQLISIDGDTALCMAQLGAVLKKHACDSVIILYTRDGVVDTARTFIGDAALLGIQVQDFTWEHKSYGIAKALPVGVKYGWNVLKDYVKQFKIIFTDADAAKSVGGFGTIGSFFPSAWNWYAFWSMTAFLSIILAFMNFLPIPALDGGYVLFLLWEMVTRRKPSDRFLEIANQIGFWLLMALLIFANMNDIIRLF